MLYVVDESSWELPTGSDVLEVIQSTLDLIQDVTEHHPCYCSERIFGQTIVDGRSFYELLDNTSEVDVHDLLEQFSALFGNMHRWEDLDGEIKNHKICLNGGVEYVGHSISWAHSKNLEAKKSQVACISTSSSDLSGFISINVSGKAADVWFASTNSCVEKFCRWSILNTGNSAKELIALAPSAFRNLDFVEGCLLGAENMGKPYRDYINAIVVHLSAFSDYGSEIFRGPRTDIAPRFGSLGVVISNENGNTRQNAKAKKARTLKHQGIERIFWWHSKIEGHRGRIHICPENVSQGENILVGIFTDHLVT